jgi:Zn-dependent protease
LAGIDLQQLLYFFVVMLISLTFHEAAHAWSADRLGDSTARSLGRLSLNPTVHIDPIGTVAMPLLAMFSGLPLLAWAKPVPVSPGNLGAAWRQKYALIALAGPVSNVLIAVVLAAARVLVGESSYSVSEFLRASIAVNVLLAVFNMLPFPPLDGGNVLYGLLPRPAADMFDRVRPYGFLILILLMVSGVLYQFIEWPSGVLLSALI